MTADIQTTLSAAEVHARLEQIPAILAGDIHDPTGKLKELYEALAAEALACIHDDFLRKSQGGTGSDGVSWPPLKAETIAYGRDHGFKKKRGERPRGLLSDAEDAQWRQVFARSYQSLLGQGVGMRDAAGHAAAHAWTVLKAQGAGTIIGVFGHFPALVLQRSGALLRSLTPGSGSPDQILEVRVEEGVIRVGSRLPQAGAHQHGNPARNLPQRKLWPEENEQLPDAWQRRFDAVVEMWMPGFLQELLK